MNLNKELLCYLTAKLLSDAELEPWFEDVSQSVGEFQHEGFTWQLQLTVTRNKDDFMEGIVGEDIFEAQPKPIEESWLGIIYNPPGLIGKNASYCIAVGGYLYGPCDSEWGAILQMMAEWEDDKHLAF